MSHEIENAFFVKEAAWHRLGTVLQNAPELDDALRLAGLDWEVESRTIQALDAGATINDESSLDTFPIVGYRANFRKSDNTFLGIVTEAYTILQNAEALAGFAPLIKDGTLKLEAAGSLMNGRKCWLLGRFEDNAEVSKGDEIIPYLLMAWGHDGKSAIWNVLTPTRVVCWNTLQAAGFKEGSPLLGEQSENRITIPHVGNVGQRVQDAAQAISIARENFASTIEVYRAMRRKMVDVQTVKDFSREVFDSDYIKAVNLIPKMRQKALEADAHKRAKMSDAISQLEDLVNDRFNNPSIMEREIVSSFEEGPGHEMAGSTVYGMFNAATDFIDHKRSTGDEASLKSIWFGRGATLRREAFSKAVSLIS